MTPWNDPSLRVASDTLHRAQYRLLQSWWREHELAVPPGHNGRQYVGSLVSHEAAQRGVNFLTPQVRAYVEDRVPHVIAADGTVDLDRLGRNLLSSQPLCFNVFGQLQAQPAEAARLLSQVFGTPMDEVLGIHVEWAPPRAEHLGDRTAFDAFVDYRVHGSRQFLGIEVKYTETFSATAYDRPEYRRVTADSGAFREGAADRLLAPATNQLWRQTLLTLSLAGAGAGEWDGGRAAVLALDGDAGVRKAVEGLAADVTRPDVVPLVGTLERLVIAGSDLPALAGWADALRCRYIDLSPIYPD